MATDAPNGDFRSTRSRLNGIKAINVKDQAVVPLPHAHPSTRRSRTSTSAAGCTKRSVGADNAARARSRCPRHSRSCLCPRPERRIAEHMEQGQSCFSLLAQRMASPRRRLPGRPDTHFWLSVGSRSGIRTQCARFRLVVAGGGQRLARDERTIRQRMFLTSQAPSTPNTE